MNKTNYPRREFLRLTLAVSGGLILSACEGKQPDGLPPGVAYYTCAMHTFVREKGPGKCPVCGMTLVPVMKGGIENPTAAPGPAMLTVPMERQQEIGVTYARVERRALRRIVRGVGMVDYDRERAWDLVARTDGYVRELYVTSPGESVGKGQKLLSFYSPDLFTAEREYVMLLGMGDGVEGLLEAARGRLKQWNVDDAEIAELERTRKPEEVVTLRSPFDGVVRTVAAEQGGSVKAGDKLAEVADLSSVWVWGEFYEVEMGAVRQGDRVAVTVKAYPGEVFEGTVSMIDPFLDEGRRTFKARVDIENAGMKLQPRMYADVAVEEAAGTGLMIPLNAVMPTGRRNLVFVDRGEGKLEPRAVVLGDEYEEGYEVKEGVSEGERVVSSATFLIDAEAQLQGALQGFDGAGPKEAGR